MYKCIVLLLFGFLFEIQSTMLRVVNNSSEEFWIGIIGNQRQHLEYGGFALKQYETRLIISPDDWVGKMWARTGCSKYDNKCITGDCGVLECNGNFGIPPMTVAEFHLNGNSGLDYYGVSLVDGYNVAVKIKPIHGFGDCKPSSCDFDLRECPTQMQFKPLDDIFGCYPACYVYARRCCREKYTILENCAPYTWPIDSLPYFKTMCKKVRQYTMDVRNNYNFTCKAKAYEISFGRMPQFFSTIEI